jgi:hypothetical protein
MRKMLPRGMGLIFHVCGFFAEHDAVDIEGKHNAADSVLKGVQRKPGKYNNNFGWDHKTIKTTNLTIHAPACIMLAVSVKCLLGGNWINNSDPPSQVGYNQLWK